MESARNAARMATSLAPDSGYAWERLAELEFSLGHRDATRHALERARTLSRDSLPRNPSKAMWRWNPGRPRKRWPGSTGRSKPTVATARLARTRTRRARRSEFIAAREHPSGCRPRTPARGFPKLPGQGLCPDTTGPSRGQGSPSRPRTRLGGSHRMVLHRPARPAAQPGQRCRAQPGARG